jgi:hypothetical protein
MTQAIQARSEQNVAIQAIVPIGTAIHAVADPGATFDGRDVGTGSALNGTIFSEAVDENGIALWARHNAGRRAAQLEGAVRIFNAASGGLSETEGALTVTASDSTAVFAGSNKVAVEGSSSGADQPAVLGTANGDRGIGVVGFANGANGFGVSGNTAFGAGTGVHGHTSTGVGVLGTSDNTGPAGRFQGNVEITGGKVTINGQDVLDLITQLQQQVTQLQQQVQNGGLTSFGQSVARPIPGSRPQLISTQTGAGAFTLTGSGFQPSIDHIHIIRRAGFTSDQDIFVFGNFVILPVLSPGDSVTVIGTDKRGDPYDTTGLLWSDPVNLSR